jgi:hypothetical protein
VTLSGNNVPVEGAASERSSVSGRDGGGDSATTDRLATALHGARFDTSKGGFDVFGARTEFVGSGSHRGGTAPPGDPVRSGAAGSPDLYGDWRESPLGLAAKRVYGSYYGEAPRLPGAAAGLIGGPLASRRPATQRQQEFQPGDVVLDPSGVRWRVTGTGDPHMLNVVPEGGGPPSKMGRAIARRVVSPPLKQVPGVGFARPTR